MTVQKTPFAPLSPDTFELVLAFMATKHVLPLQCVNRTWRASVLRSPRVLSLAVRAVRARSVALA